MRLIEVQIKNFGSYKDLKLSFDKTGLALIHGETGSGKSTIMDIVAWALYGKTVKGIAVGDVTSWGADSTEGSIEFELKGKHYRIVRIRRADNKNDLYCYTDGSTEPWRAKNIIETQQAIEGSLGLSFLEYTYSNYFSEFNKTSAFFTSSSEVRRQLFNNIVKLDFFNDLKLTIGSGVKTIGKDETRLKSEIKHKLTTFELQRLNHQRLLAKKTAWSKINNEEKKSYDDREKALAKEIQLNIKNYTVSAEKFEKDKRVSLFAIHGDINYLQAKIDNQKICPHCNRGEIDPLIHRKLTAKIIELQQLSAHEHNLAEKIEKETQRTLPPLVNIENPFNDEIVFSNERLYEQEKDLEITQLELQEKIKELKDLTNLEEANKRAKLRKIQDAVMMIEIDTNTRLEQFFDSKFRVKFELTDAEDIEAQIAVNDQVCNFAQLSKGQRSIIKLCFSISVMEATSRSTGAFISSLFFDEALDGMDSDIKLMAFNLFKSLEAKYDNILVIDHDTEIRAMFDNKFEVVMQDNESKIV